MTFERITRWEPAYDRRDPNPALNYGVHGMNVRFVLRGERGAVQFLIFTGWQLQHVQEEFDHVWGGSHRTCHPMAADLGFHALPREGQTDLYECEWLPGGKCYYDGSSLNAEQVYWRFVAEGEEVMWRMLEEYYAEVFEGARV